MHLLSVYLINQDLYLRRRWTWNMTAINDIRVKFKSLPKRESNYPTIVTSFRLPTINGRAGYLPPIDHSSKSS